MFYDNTLRVKQEAKRIEASGLLDKIIIGNQTQLYNIGQKVNANGIENATITDTWTINGFVYYEIQWGKRKKYTSRERQQDLTAC